MATLLADGDIIEVRHVSHYDDQVGLNRRYFEVSNSAGGGITDQEAAGGLDGIAAPLYKACMAAAATYRGVSVQRALPAPRTVAVVSTANAGAGLNAGDVLPKQVSGLISLRTDFAGRAFRGRAYIPFPSEASNAADSQPVAGYITVLDNLAAYLIGAHIIAGGGGASATLTGVLWRPPAGVTYTYAQAISSNRWATQRRRGDYGAQNPLPF